MKTIYSGSPGRRNPLLKIYTLGLAFLCLALWTVPAASGEETSYTFDLSEIEKKPWHWGGYIEFKPVLFGLDRDAAFHKLRLYDDPQGDTLMEWNGRLQLEGSYETGMLRLYAKANTDLKETYSGFTERSAFYEAYATIKPSSSLKIDLGKKTSKWGKGYAWNPVAFADRPKDPDEPEAGMEGYIAVSADYIKSFDGPLKTFSFTPLLLPVYNHVNEDFGNRDKVNFAGKFYFLLYDTDIDLMFMTGGSRPDRYGIDFSRNITTNFEIHGEWAYLRHTRKTVLTAAGAPQQSESNARSWLVGIRHLTAFDLTTIIEYYHNGTGYNKDELTRYYDAVHNAYATYITTGSAAPLAAARRLADTGYGRFSAGKDYVYVRLIQKEPFDILYFTPALTAMINFHDKSASLTPEILYTGFTNWEIRLRTGFLMGSRGTEFGDKQNDCRVELRVGYYF
ncbi:MAG: hypothetical protein JW943_00510 [Deltaproteobacteria bacterium]|nr:hypothetical protein [Deltaproteobacteria bacterium]